MDCWLSFSIRSKDVARIRGRDDTGNNGAADYIDALGNDKGDHTHNFVEQVLEERRPSA